MTGLHYALAAIWAIFWIYWFASARGVKRTLNSRRGAGSRLGLWLVAVVVIRLWHPRGLVMHSIALGVIGLVIVLCGLAIAIWARVYLGRNWGMPMSVKEDPELITAGPYSRVRHPIYSGILLAFLGTVLLTSVVTLAIVIVFTVIFIASATVEERNMTSAFPDTYPAYRARTKMLIPFVF